MKQCRLGWVLVAAGVLALSACSRDSADWKSATAADTTEAYQQFLQQHPTSANATQAHARIQQLEADRDWQAAAAADTRDAYEQFLAQHADSKWAQEARIRVENFAQADAASAPAGAAPKITPPTSAPAAAPMPKARAGSGAPAPAPTRVATASGVHGHYVQLGAFSSKQRAQSEWKVLAARFPAQLKSLQPRYVPGKSKGERVYRLQVGVSSENAATGLCAALKKHAQACVPGTA